MSIKREHFLKLTDSHLGRIELIILSEKLYYVQVSLLELHPFPHHTSYNSMISIFVTQLRFEVTWPIRQRSGEQCWQVTLYVVWPFLLQFWTQCIMISLWHLTWVISLNIDKGMASCRFRIHRTLVELTWSFRQLVSLLVKPVTGLNNFVRFCY
jgi:hypothetical protein